MSRVIVKNLPSKISAEDLKKHFSQKGTVTDVKLIYKNGEFRRYGFVGFESEEACREACSYFNNSFIRQAKINVEVCQDLKSTDKPRTWREKNKVKKQALKEKMKDDSKSPTSKNEKSKKKKKKELKYGDEYLQAYQDDPEFKDFVNSSKRNLDDGLVMQTPGTDSGTITDDEDSNNQDEVDVKIAHKKEISDLDYLKSLKVSSTAEDASSKGKRKLLLGMEERYTLVIRTKERCKIRQKGKVTFTKQSIKDFLKPLKCKSLRIPPKHKYVAYVGFKTEREMRRALQKNKSFLNGARVRVSKYEEPVTEEGSSHGKENAPWSAAEEKIKKTEPVAETGKLFVRNLWYSVTEDDLRNLFDKYGKIADIDLPICKLTRRPKGFATVTFMFPEHSVRAMTALDGTTFKGRLLHILPGHTDEKEKEK
ncbi:putative RNA-binding protein 19, partial [Halocaridina rubra]